MAPNQILVSGSSTSYVNGVYTKSETTGFEGSPIYIHTTAWVPPEGASGPGMAYLAPSIVLEAGGPTRFWRIYFAAPAPWSPLLILIYSHTSNQVVPSETWPGEWPGDNTTDPVIAWAGQPLLSITEYIPPANDPVTLRNNKYATATESGANRFRRLLSLGYV